MKTRVGKIARLPNAVREQLNQKLFDGVPGKEIVSWLNALPEVHQILAEFFQSRAITEQNISVWRCGGYQDWLQSKETHAQALRFVEQCQQLDPEARLQQIHNLLAVEIKTAMHQLRQIKDPDDRWRKFRRVSREFLRLQKQQTHGLALQLQERTTLAARNFHPLPPA